MKNVFRVFGLIALAAVIGFSIAACGDNNSDDGGGGGGGGTTFTSIGDFEKWLNKQPDNTADTAYTIKLNIKKLGDYRDYSSLYNALDRNSKKYVYLDFSGSTITEIPDNTFGYILGSCSNLTGVTIPDSVTRIGAEAFRWTNLTGITIPDSVTNIGDAAFWGCASLTSVTLPTNASFTTIGRIVFYGCTSLTSVTIPSSVTNIGSNAFYGCTSLTGITIPNSVTSIEYYAFADCSSLTSVTLPTNASFTSIETATFEGCTSLTGVTIPDSVTNIKERAFNGCAGLTSITIPDSVTNIGGGAFYSCTNLTSVTFQGTIASANFISDELGHKTFFGDLRSKYLATDGGGIGTYTRESGGSTWTKQ